MVYQTICHPISHLLRYPFLLPLVFLYLTDHNVMTRLLLTCKAIKPFLRYYRFKQELAMDNVADFIMDKYWLEMITNISGVYSRYEPEIAKMTSLRRVQYEETGGDTPFDVHMIPDSVAEIEMWAYVEDRKERYPGWMPSLITRMFLEYGEYTEIELTDVLPTMLRSLDLKLGFGQGLPVGWLPNSLTYLNWDDVGNNVNLDCSMLPPSLVSLTLGFHFNGTLIAPQSLLHLTLPYYSDPKMFPEGLPSSLQSFSSYSRIHTPLPIIKQIHFPKSLTYLSTCQLIECNLPENLTRLEYYTGKEVVQTNRLIIPSSVTDLDLVIPTPLDENMPVLGPSITHLKLDVGGGWSCPQGFIPPSVTHLNWGDLYDMKIESYVVPTSINCDCSTPCLCGLVKQTFVSCIPNSVTHLTFGDSMVSPLKVGDIPHSVTHLSINSLFGFQLVRGVIPDCVTDLSFGDKFNQPLQMGSIPDSVQYLKFGEEFCQSLPLHVLPASLKRLIFARPQTIDVAHVTADIEYVHDQKRIW